MATNTIMNTENSGFFITGTNTEVGKTYVTALLAKALAKRGQTVGVYKPVASGCIQHNGELLSQDAEQLWNAAGRPRTLAEVTPQLFLAPLAPNVAASAAGQRVDPELLRSGLRVWQSYDVTLVEGVGGLMSPISDSDLVVDLAFEFGYPLLIVVANQLGCISQTLLTLECARGRGIPVAGIILNSLKSDSGTGQETDVSRDSNLNQLRQWASCPVLATVNQNDADISLEKMDDWL